MRIAFAMVLVFAGLWFKLAPLIVIGGIIVIADALLARK